MWRFLVTSLRLWGCELAVYQLPNVFLLFLPNVGDYLGNLESLYCRVYRCIWGRPRWQSEVINVWWLTVVTLVAWGENFGASRRRIASIFWLARLASSGLLVRGPLSESSRWKKSKNGKWKVRCSILYSRKYLELDLLIRDDLIYI